MDTPHPEEDDTLIALDPLEIVEHVLAAENLTFDRTEDGDLAFAWLVAADQQVIEMFQLSRQSYNDIADDCSDWQPLRDQLSQGLFVDLRRLLTDSAGAAPANVLPGSRG